MKKFSSMCVAFALLLLAGCASTDYSAFEGSKLYHGNGGTKKVVDGVEVWTLGEPPRDFRIVGIIDDTRKKAPMQMMSYYSDIAKKVKEVGGDAAVILSSNVADVGTYFTPAYVTGTTRSTVYGNNGQAIGYTTSTTSSGSQAVAIREQSSKIAVIQYEK